MPLPLVQPARVDFSGIGNLPGQYMQAQNQAAELRALAEQRDMQQRQRAARGEIDYSQPATGQLDVLARAGLSPDKLFGMKQEAANATQAKSRADNIRAFIAGAEQRGVITPDVAQGLQLMDDADEALKGFQQVVRGGKPTAAMLNAGFVFPDDVNAQRRFVRQSSLPVRGGASGPTPAQTANNHEIRAARNKLTAMARANGYEDLDEYVRDASIETNRYGQRNTLFNPIVADLYRTANNYAVGGDPGFDSFNGLTGSPAIQPNQPPQGPGAPDYIARDLTTPKVTPATGGYGVGAVSPVPVLTANEAGRSPSGQQAEPIPTGANGIEADKLQVGGLYDDGQSGIYRWDGNTFHPVQ